VVDALQHQWEDLGQLKDVQNWPSAARARERLFHRMVKDQEALATETGDHTLLMKHERREALEVSFEQVQEYYQSQKKPTTASAH
jgi:hypothetical protein